jgi:hypothetical protein
MAKFDIFKACSWIERRNSARTLRQFGSEA